MVRVYCAHGFNSAHGVAWCVRASHAVFTYRSAAATGRSRPALTPSTGSKTPCTERKPPELNQNSLASTSHGAV
eukprot:3531007-Prymnesium_polylepis.1